MDKDHVFPPRNLPGVANEWGRQVEVAHKDNAQGLEILGQSLQGLNRSTASSLQDLSRQVQDLVGRTSYSTDYGDISSPVTWTSTQASIANFSTPISFTIIDNRVVNLTFQVLGRVHATRGTGTSVSTLDIDTQINGSYGSSEGIAGTMRAFTNSGTASYDEKYGTITSYAEWRLTPGTYTATGILANRDLSTTGTGSGGGYAYLSFLRVDINQPW